MVIENKLDTPLQEEDEELISEKRLRPKEAERKKFGCFRVHGISFDEIA